MPVRAIGLAAVAAVALSGCVEPPAPAIGTAQTAVGTVEPGERPADLEAVVGLFAQVLRHTRNRAPGADRAGKCVDATLGIPPDFGTGRFVVGEAIGEIIELVDPHRAVDRCRVATGLLLVVHVVGVGNGRHHADLRTQGFENSDLFR